MRNFNIFFILFTFLQACSSLEWAQQRIEFRANQGEDFVASNQLFGITIHEEDYYSAMKRWPAARGEHLKRRALILALGPTAKQLDRLNRSHSEQRELEIINDLLAQTNESRKVSKN